MKKYDEQKQKSFDATNFEENKKNNDEPDNNEEIKIEEEKEIKKENEEKRDMMGMSVERSEVKMTP